MRRAVLIVGLLASAAMVFGLSRWMATHTITIGRPSLGGPPPPPGGKVFVRPADLLNHAVPSFSATDLDGHPISTAALRGRVFVVDVWATWCHPCIDELPRLEREVWQPHRQDVTVVAVAERQDAGIVAKFNQQAKLTFPLVADPDSKITRLFPGNSIPRTYVVDRSGRIVHQSIGYGPQAFGDLVAAVEQAIKRPS